MLDTAPPLALVADGGASVVPGWHAAAVTNPAFHPPHTPVAPTWQRCLNAVDVPPRREQRDVTRGALVRARWVWERDGEAWLDGRVISVWERRGYEDVVLVHRLHRDPRGQTHGEWLWAHDVIRVAGVRIE